MTQPRQRLWFDRYSWAMSFQLAEASALRILDHNRIDRVIDVRRAWDRRVSNQPGSWWVRDRSISDQDLVNLHSACDVLLTIQDKIKLMLSGNRVHVYTNYRDIEQSLRKIPGISDLKIREAVDTQKATAIYLKNPQHRYRSFLRNSKITSEQFGTLSNFLNSQQDMRLGPALDYWTKNSALYRTQDYFFFDHDNMSLITMLNLVIPGMIRKTLPIVSYK